jgi:NADH-quinone oxidoreductase subunit F
MHGSDGLKEHIEAMVSALEEQQSGGALFTVETTECLGHCEAAPTLMINENIMGPVQEEEVADLIHPLKIKSI